MTESEVIAAKFASAVAAWNRGDADGYLSIYAQSKTVRWISDGTLRIGWDAIAAAVKARFASGDAGQLRVSQLDVECLGISDALVFGHWELQGGEGLIQGVFTVHLKKAAGQWQIVSDHAATLVNYSSAE